MCKVFDENLPCPDDVQSSLHHRIADALFDACCRFDVPDSERRDMADAVIEALNLKIVVDYMSVDGQRRNFMLAGNYTTEKQ